MKTVFIVYCYNLKCHLENTYDTMHCFNKKCGILINFIYIEHMIGVNKLYQFHSTETDYTIHTCIQMEYFKPICNAF